MLACRLANLVQYLPYLVVWLIQPDAVGRRLQGLGVWIRYAGSGARSLMQLRAIRSEEHVACLLPDHRIDRLEVQKLRRYQFDFFIVLRLLPGRAHLFNWLQFAQLVEIVVAHSEILSLDSQTNLF